MSKKTIALVFSAIAASVVAVVLGTTSMTYAAGDYGTHAKVADLNKCYTGGKLKPQIEIGSIYSVNDLLQGDGDILALPNNKGGNGLFSCGKLLQDIGVTIPKDDSKAQANLLTRLGYEGTGSNSYKCQVYTYRSSFTVEGRSSEVSEIRKSMLCASVDASDNIISFSSDGGSVQEVNGASFSPDGSQILINYADGSYGNVSGGIGNNFYTVASAVDSALRSHGYIYVDGLYGTGACFTEDWVHVSCSSDKAVHRSLPTSGIRFDYQGMSKGSSEDSLTGSSVYTLKPANEAFKIAEKSFLGTNYETPTVFSVEERNQLIRDYIKEYGEFSCYDDGGVPLNSNGTTIYVNKKNGAPDTFYIPSTYTWFGQTDWNGVVSAAQGIDLGINCEDGSDTPPGGGAGRVDDATEIDADDKPCFNGAGALGWIVCPVIKFLRLTLETIYENIVVPFLQINAKTFSNENGGVVAGWQAFQGFANLAFVALLLIVIFSQVTGVGIDNLGIKRILPKLIIAAVLINLSYIICQLLVDASNISGYGLRSLFDSIQVGETNITGTGQTIMNTALTAAVTAMAGYGAAATASIWAPFLILPFLLALVGMLISVLFMFILLGVRQAGVIILVVVSPLAFAMYMLPNTKPLFQRWWKAFTGLLLLFPICGAMIGGADLAGKILASTSSEFWPNLIAALLTVVPFFFIPTLLKGSFSALGNLGAKISGVGAKIGARAGGIAKAGVERTGAFRNIQANAQERQDIRNRVAERKRLEGTTKRIGSIAEGMRTPEQRMQYARAQAALEKMEDEDDFNSRPDWIVSEAQAKRFNRRVEAAKSQNVSSGAVNMAGDVGLKDFRAAVKEGRDPFKSGSLAHILYNSSVDDMAGQYAAVSQLMASGHHGAEALHQVMEALDSKGDDASRSKLENIAKAMKGDNKLGEIKSGARSTYDYINDLAAGEAKGNIADYAGKVKWNNMSEQQLINTDKEELQRYAQHIENIGYDKIMNSKDDEYIQEKALISQASAAWNNDRLRGGAKKEVQNIVSQIAFNEVRDANGASLNVKHNNTSSAPRTSADRVNAATNRLEEIARQRNNGGGA